MEKKQYECGFRSTLHRGGAGLGIYIDLGYREIEAYSITIYSCSMYKNTASVGANMLLSVYLPVHFSLTIHVVNCMFFWRKQHQHRWRGYDSNYIS